MMHKVLFAIVVMTFAAGPALAVTKAEDLATTIMLRGHACGGKTVSNISESEDAQGNKTIRATCPNGVRYEIYVTTAGRVSVRPL